MNNYDYYISLSLNSKFIIQVKSKASPLNDEYSTIATVSLHAIFRTHANSSVPINTS